MPAKKVQKETPKKVEKKETPKKVEKKETPKKVEKKEAPKKVEKKEAPKKVEKKEAPKKTTKKISAKEMEALRKQNRKWTKAVRCCMNLKTQERWGKVLSDEEKAKIAKEPEFRKERDAVREKLAAVSL